MKKIKKQQGFTLVTVLILSSIASILVLNSFKDNISQERLSGNFQKSINSTLASEQGMYTAMAAAEEFLAGNSSATLEDLKAELESGNSLTGSSKLTHEGTTYDVDVDITTGELVLTSTGERLEGESEVKIRLQIVAGTGGGFSTYSDAVVGCEGVDLAGSGSVDSYNSNDGDYDPDNAGSNGDVKTIDESAGDITLTGNSPINGNVTLTGSLTVEGSPQITGNVHANKDVTLIGNNTIGGYVWVGGDYRQESYTIKGNVRVAGDVWIKYGGGGNIDNNQNDGLDVQYGGTITGNDGAVAAYGDGYVEDLEVARVKNSDVTADDYDASDPATNCDHLDIGSLVDTIKIDSGDITLNEFYSKGWSVTYTLTPTDLSYNASEDYDIISTEFLGEAVNFISFGDFTLMNDTMVIDGDVYLYIDGDFNMLGNPLIKINDNSSLTVVITGKFNLLNGKITNSNNAWESDLTNAPNSLNIYSSYSSDDTGNDAGITLAADFDMYAEIYAPLADVDITASGHLYGAVRAKTVSVTGGAEIHYDEALLVSSETSTGSSGSSATIEFIGFEY